MKLSNFIKVFLGILYLSPIFSDTARRIGGGFGRVVPSRATTLKDPTPDGPNLVQLAEDIKYARCELT